MLVRAALVDRMSCPKKHPTWSSPPYATSSTSQYLAEQAAHHRSTDVSLLRRLQATTARNAELAQDNQRLRHQLAQALGQFRVTATPGERRN